MARIIGQSTYWEPLWKLYRVAPSIVLCRVPELEFAANLPADGNLLDHCCGDVAFASLAWPTRKIAAGCDANPRVIEQARRRSLYQRCDVCDAAHYLPYADHQFDVVFNNSALEHIYDLDAVLAHISRVLKPNGLFAFNVLNHRFFEWWPLSRDREKAYRAWQPFFHALSLDEWRKRLEKAGLEIVACQGYLDQSASRELAWLDHTFSGVSLGGQLSAVVLLTRLLPRWMDKYWRVRLASLVWETGPDEGAGYSIRAIRHGI